MKKVRVSKSCYFRRVGDDRCLGHLENHEQKGAPLRRKGNLNGHSRCLALLSFSICTLVVGQEFDDYGGSMAIEATATGFFRIEEYRLSTHS